MATINLGSIKFKWQGAYAGGTAYTVDDVVSYNGSSYICILASTGNLPTNATYWEQMSSAGTNGTDGTDLGTTLTTQGDIVYRDGSGLARLGAGTSGQVLQTNGTGANPSWGTVSSDYVKLATIDHSGSDVSEVNVDGFFSSTYKSYKVIINTWMMFSTGRQAWLRFRTSGGTQSSDYHTVNQNANTTGSTGVQGINSASNITLSYDASSSAGYSSSYVFTIHNATDTTQYSTITGQSIVIVNNNVNDTYVFNNGGIWTNTTALTGLNFTGQASATSIRKMKGAIYGIK